MSITTIHDGFTTGTLSNPFQRVHRHVRAADGAPHHQPFRISHDDMSNQPVFLKGSNPVLAQNTLTAGLVFTFDSREAK